MRRGVRVLLSLGVTLLLLYLFLRRADLAGAWRETRQARPAWLALSVAGSYLHYALRAARWRLMLAPSGKLVSFRLALSCTAVGYFLSAVLPGRPGELVRPILLGMRSGLSRSFALATVLVERVVLDPLTILVLLALALVGGGAGIEASPESERLRDSVWVVESALAAALVLGLPVAAWALARRRRALDWLRRRAALSARGAGLLGALERFADGLAALGNRRLWPAIALTSLATWAAVALGLWGGVRSFGVEVGYGAALVLTALAAAGVAVPTPGGVGGFHLAVQIGLTTLYGASIEQSVPAALFTHLLLLLPALTIGAWSVWRQGLDLASLWRRAERWPPAADS